MELPGTEQQRFDWANGHTRRPIIDRYEITDRRSESRLEKSPLNKKKEQTNATARVLGENQSNVGAPPPSRVDLRASSSTSRSA